MSQPATPPVPAADLPTLEAVALLLPAMRIRYQRSGRWITFGLAALFGTMGLLIAPSSDTRGAAAVGFGLVGVLLATLIRAFVQRDLRGVDAVLVSGAVYPATLSVSRLDAMAAGAVQGYGTRGGGYSVRWSMGDRTYSARFAPLTFKPPARSVAVVANRHRRILVAIDGKLFSAKRPLRIERSDRFPYVRLS